ncbi:UV DNA damage repair endonuclease UvsE [Ammoniphilus sp. CFH 90114]|uniref:UV DNA damage repair endonuclease UvsE n=1 Tax=Ammoniphilus sp. CFH 90114 TaxID=2493665 RepID=UPI00100E0C9F|nr:UV DNA damage repair endonuclease UvsE [Ammoniphilus sp. CFH 90114]RXT07275.1 UV DNA damage repair endonuclease UvsE [Ammoniphilus sp. CFH 90114]
MRLGYSSINLSLEGNYRTCRKATWENQGYSIIKELTIHNFARLLHILQWNIMHRIFFHRMSTNIVPLASFPGMDYRWWEDPDVTKWTEQIRQLQQTYDLRLSMHPAQYTVLSAENPAIVDKSIEDLIYHNRVLDLVGGTDLIIHGGGAYGNIESAKNRWIANYLRLEKGIRDKLRLENDHNTYHLRDVLDISQTLKAEHGEKLAVCFDIHHHNCHHNDEPLPPMLDEVFHSWNGLGKPKMHISSGRTHPLDPNHHEYIFKDDYDRLMVLLNGRDIDLMIEAKLKDKALLRLYEDIGVIDPLPV